MRSGLRGHTRATFFLARRFKSLAAVPIAFEDRSAVFVDLRLEGSHEWLEGCPWKASPIEIDEQHVLSRITRAGDVVFDIGANIGLHTGLLSRLVGPTGMVYAFEPNPQLAACLEKTIAAAHNARLYQVALSDEDSDAVLYVPDDHTKASLADWTRGESRNGSVRVHCEQTTLDALIRRDSLPLPAVIKCDVEGAELKVFKGGHRTLNRASAPLILFEANVHNARGFNRSVSAAREYLSSLCSAAFEFFTVSTGGSLTRADNSECEHANILAVPRTKMSRIESIAEVDPYCARSSLPQPAAG
jgi:FkbM family methyltransferase